MYLLICNKFIYTQIFTMKSYQKMLVILLISVTVAMSIWEYTVYTQSGKFSFIKPIFIMWNRALKPSKTRVILAWNGFFGLPLWFWEEANKGKKSVNKTCANFICMLTTEKSMLNQSNMVLFHLVDSIPALPPYRKANQDWALAIWESPVHTGAAYDTRLQNVFNRSISYKLDSDLSLPYGWVAKKEEKPRNSVPEIAQGKTKLIIWFVSNCAPRERKDYAANLQKHVPIDIFGGCGKPDPCKHESTCSKKMEQKYKFCLAFENSQCRDYITEKYWIQAIAGCVPIVLGPSEENYNRIVPVDSFLHVDNFTSPKELASYIKYLDNNDEAYYKYHMWRNKYRILYRDNKENKISLCDFCSVLDAKPHKAYNLKEYWGKENNCK